MWHFRGLTRPMATLKKIIEDNDTRAGRAMDLVIQTLIVLSIVSFSIETLPSLSSEARKILRYTEVVCITCFTIEYLLRLWVSDRRLAFATSFFGIIDLLAILPFYLSLGIDLRSVRALRLLRVFRAFKLARYSKAIQRFHCALLIAKEELVLFFVVTVLLLYLSAVGIYYFERDAQPQAFGSIFHSLWWAVATMTTVGYGDVYPITAGGKLFTFFVLMLGLGIIAMPAGLVASALSEARKIEKDAAATVGPAGTKGPHVAPIQSPGSESTRHSHGGVNLREQRQGPNY